MGKIKAVHNLNKTEWWPLTSVACFKLVPPNPESQTWRVVARMKTSGNWVAVYETPMKAQAEAWIEVLYE